jgi:hypothetical protein
MASDLWTFIQHALIFTFEPIIGYYLAGIAFSGVLIPLYVLILSLLRWLSGKGSLV